MKSLPRQSAPQPRNFMQEIVGLDWVPEVYLMHASRQFGKDVIRKLQPSLMARLSSGALQKVAARRKRKLTNPCLVQLKTFAI